MDKRISNLIEFVFGKEQEMKKKTLVFTTTDGFKPQRHAKNGAFYVKAPLDIIVTKGPQAVKLGLKCNYPLLISSCEGLRLDGVEVLNAGEVFEPNTEIVLELRRTENMNIPIKYRTEDNLTAVYPISVEDFED
jgi:hypothetical protein